MDSHSEFPVSKDWHNGVSERVSKTAHAIAKHTLYLSHQSAAAAARLRKREEKKFNCLLNLLLHVRVVFRNTQMRKI
jgi:hypothetical protein